MLHLVALAAFALQDPAADKTARIQEGMKRADWLIGAWTVTSKAGGADVTGTVTWESLMDGCFLQAKEKFTAAGKTDEATVLLTFDPDRGRLVAHHIRKTGEYHFYVGTVSDDGSTWTFNEPYKDKFRTRYTLKKLSDTESSSRFEQEDEKGEWKEMSTGASKKG